jgi:SAM-dependent methyltransferase
MRPHTAAEQTYWDEIYATYALRYEPQNVEFRDLFDRFLPESGSCFEVGCYPGHYLTYLCKRFKYIANGIDTTTYVETRFRTYLESLNIPVGELVHGDFFTFESEIKHDVVCSFGFVEHFLDVERVIEMHIDLLKPGGILVVSAPNFRGMQYLLHWLLDPDDLYRHVVSSMKLSRWRTALVKRKMSILYHGYYRTADFWADTQRPGDWVLPAIERVTRFLNLIDRKINWPNAWLSPFMISISRKP